MYIVQHQNVGQTAKLWASYVRFCLHSFLCLVVLAASSFDLFPTKTSRSKRQSVLHPCPAFVLWARFLCSFSQAVTLHLLPGKSTLCFVHGKKALYVDTYPRKSTFEKLTENWYQTLKRKWHRNLYIKPVLNWANVCSPNILRTLRRTMIRFLIELLVRRIWFGQSKLYFILNWLVMRCKLRPELAADAQQTACSKM